MKFLFCIVALLAVVAVSCLLFVQADKELEAKLEVVKVHKCGHVDFKLTNLGAGAIYSGYGKDCPLSLIDRKVNSEWIIGRGPWCGTGIKSLRIRRGESVSFTAANWEDKSTWRLALDLYEGNNKPEWVTKMLNYFDVYEDYSSIKLTSIEIDTFLNQDSKCTHIRESNDIEEVPETSSLK